jgi:putative solute:sodium symporter small subunit
MSDSNNGYHISFFKPTTPQALANRNLTLWLLLIWFVAVFGFHFLMRGIEKPTKEAALISFENAWANVESGNAGPNDYQEIGKSTLLVLGKAAVSDDDRVMLSNAFSNSVYMLIEDSLKADFVAKVQEFETLKEGIKNIANVAYVEAKQEISGELSPVLNLSFMDVRSTLLPLMLESDNIEALSEETKSLLHATMSKYTIHYQSFLTDTTFLGFPFHYFYSAVFLLILFVGLCWLYCVRTDKLNAKFNIVD